MVQKKKLSAAIQKHIPALPKSDRLPVIPAGVPEAASQATPAAPDRFPHNLPQTLNIVRGNNGKAYSVRIAPNGYVIAVGSNQLNQIIRRLARQEGVKVRAADLDEINQSLQAFADAQGVTRLVCYRVAPIDGGLEIDLGDEAHTRVQITPGFVEVVDRGSGNLFYRTPVSQPLPVPAAAGDLKAVRKYLNLSPASVALFIAWLSYTLAHPKVPSSKFVILVLQGGQGSGKTWVCKNVILGLIDPSLIGVQVLSNNAKDLAIAGQNAHVLCFDNVRAFTQQMADWLCIAATGGALSSRQLYTDEGQQVLRLHVALVLNGIHSFVDQPDLASRCLPIALLPLAEDLRRSEVALEAELAADLPKILRGLYDLIAKILIHLPTAEVTNPERMLDFVQWLAAMERAEGVPPGIYQAEYSAMLRQGQLDSLMDNPLAAAMLGFAKSLEGEEWVGTPGQLYAKLNEEVSRATQWSREWPRNEIALSKRLLPLQAGLRTQGISIEFGRGKHRTITLQGTQEVDDDKY